MTAQQNPVMVTMIVDVVTVWGNRVAIIEHANIACDTDQSAPSDIFILAGGPPCFSLASPPVGRIKKGAKILIAKLRMDE